MQARYLGYLAIVAIEELTGENVESNIVASIMRRFTGFMDGDKVDAGFTPYERPLCDTGDGMAYDRDIVQSFEIDDIEGVGTVYITITMESDGTEEVRA